jgi:hypothetical protein
VSVTKLGEQRGVQPRWQTRGNCGSRQHRACRQAKILDFRSAKTHDCGDYRLRLDQAAGATGRAPACKARRGTPL